MNAPLRAGQAPARARVRLTPARITLYVSLAILFWVLIALVAYPMYRTLVVSITGDSGGLTLKHYAEFFSRAHPANLEALWHSLYISVLSVIICGLIGVPLAFLFGRYEFWGRRTFSAMVMLPLMMPSLVAVLAFIYLYGESGMITYAIQKLLGMNHPPFVLKGATGILFVHAYTQYVYFYTSVSSTIRSLDPALEEAAYNLGASRWQVLTRVTLPLLTPALVAGALLVFMVSMASFSAPLLLAGTYRVLGLQIYISKLNGDMAMSATQAMVLAAFSITFLLVMRWYEAQRTYAMATKGVSGRRNALRSPASQWAIVLISSIVTLILALPLLAIMLVSFVPEGTWTTQIYPTHFGLQNYTKLFYDLHTWEPVANSLKMSIWATAATMVYGVLAAYVMAKRKFRSKGLMDLMIMVPWVLPASVVAVNYVLAFNLRTIFSAGQVLVGTVWILPIAYFMRHVPLVTRPVGASLTQLDDSMEEAAANLGASWWTTFRRVVLPGIMPAIVAGGLLTFVTNVGEFTLSIMLYVFSNRPLSVEIKAQMEQFNMGQAAAFGVVQSLMILTVLLISSRLNTSNETQGPLA